MELKSNKEYLERIAEQAEILVERLKRYVFEKRN